MAGSQKQPVCPSPGEHKQTPCVHTRTDCAHEAVSRGANGTRELNVTLIRTWSLHKRGKVRKDVLGQLTRLECRWQASCTQLSGVEFTLIPVPGLWTGSPTPRKHIERPGGDLQGHFSLTLMWFTKNTVFVSRVQRMERECRQSKGK